MTHRAGPGRNRVLLSGAAHCRGRPRWSAKRAVRRMGACAETRQSSKGNDHRIDRVCVLRAFLAGGPGLAEASARQELSRIRDSVALPPEGRVWRGEFG